MSKRKRIKRRSYEDIKINGDWVMSYSYLDGATGYKETALSLSGARWCDINSRCNPNGAQQRRYPTYKGIINAFESFQHFVEWSRMEFGYNLFEEVSGKPQPWVVDKDLLGGLCYSEDSCLFIPSSVNNFLTYNQCRGKGLTGTKLVPSGKYEARVSDGGKYKYLGLFDTEIEAHNAWRRDKSKQAVIFAEEYYLLGHSKLGDGLIVFSEDIGKELKPDDVDLDEWYMDDLFEKAKTRTEMIAEDNFEVWEEGEEW